MRSFARFSLCRAVFNLAVAFGTALALTYGCTGDSDTHGNDATTCAKGQQLYRGQCVCIATLARPEKGQCPLVPVPFPKSNVVEGPNSGNGIGLALDGRNIPHLSYYEANNADLHYAILDYDTRNWKVETVDANGDVGQYSSLALFQREGDLGVPVIAYYDASSRLLKGAFRAKDGWKTRLLDPTDPLQPAERGTYTSIAIFNGNRHVAHIAYINQENRDLMYLSWDLDRNEVAPARTVDSGITFIDGQPYGSGIIDEHTSIALDSKGAPIIAYRDTQMGDLKVAVYKPDSDSWDVTFVDDNPLVQVNSYDVGQFASVAVDDIDNIHVAYHDRTNKQLRYTMFDGSEWLRPQVIDRGGAGMFASIALRKSDRSPFIAYFDDARQLAKIAHHKRDGTWQIEVVATQGLPGHYMRLALTDQGFPAIAYREYWSQRTIFDFVTWVVFP